MNKKMDQLCRKSRSHSISPSISFEHKDLTEEEMQEKLIYSAPINEMVKELFTSFDDIIKFVNHSILTKIKDNLNDATEEEQNEIDQVKIIK